LTKKQNVDRINVIEECIKKSV